MPPKLNVNELDSNTKFFFSVLKHCDQIKPDWEAVAAENGIGYARNAAGKFRDVLKKYGYKFEQGKIIEDESNGSTTPIGTPRSTKTTKQQVRTPTSAGKKRTVTNNKGSSAKKRKTTKIPVEENDSEDAEAEDADDAMKDETDDSDEVSATKSIIKNEKTKREEGTGDLSEDSLSEGEAV